MHGFSETGAKSCVGKYPRSGLGGHGATMVESVGISPGAMVRAAVSRMFPRASLGLAIALANREGSSP
jgi:hypothetical protein